MISGKVSDANTGASQGIVVIGLVSTGGKWQFSVNNGTTWADVGTVSATTALLLRSTDKLRFVPTGTATTASVTFRAWDQTGTTAGKQGTKVSAVAVGTTTPFSSGSFMSTIAVS